MGLELARQLAEEHHRARAQDAEPESFDVRRARIVADLVEDRIGPRPDGEGLRGFMDGDKHDEPPRSEGAVGGEEER